LPDVDIIIYEPKDYKILIIHKPVKKGRVIVKVGTDGSYVISGEELSLIYYN
jgi:hypothetical protein